MYPSLEHLVDPKNHAEAGMFDSMEEAGGAEGPAA
jgi:hypothetical protein